MIKKAKNHLSLIFVVTTGLIFTMALLGANYLFEEQDRRNQMDRFQALFYSLTGMIQRENSVNYSDLFLMEKENQSIIYIEDNGIPISYEGAWNFQTEREKLVDELKKLGRNNNVNFEIKPISVKELSSDIYIINGEKGEVYLGKIFVAAVKQDYRSLFMIQRLKSDINQKTERYLFFGGLELAGITALYLISRWLIRKVLQPVEENRRKQTEFIAAASHELRSPLAVIRADITAIHTNKEKADYFFNGIKKECQRMSRLIDDLLLLASADAKNWTVKQEIFDSDTILIEVYEAFYTFCKEHDMELKLELPDKILPKIKGDKERLKQVLAILIDNAVFYGKVSGKEKSGTVCLTCTGTKNKAVLSVIDYGNGIEKEKQKEIFERFYRVDKSRKDKTHFGLGLSIAKELVELHQGRIFVKDTKNGGCTFVVEIPVWNENN